VAITETEMRHCTL